MATINICMISDDDEKFATKRKRDAVFKKIDENKINGDEEKSWFMEKLLKEPDFVPAFLSAKNPHALDATIRFVESTHTYYVNFKCNNFICEHVMSTSGLVHAYFKPFDADHIISKMGKKSRGTPRYRGMSNAEIKQSWADAGTKASGEGTKFHFLLESFYNGMNLGPFENYKVIEQFRNWEKEVLAPLNVLPFRSEQRFRTGLQHRLTGTADMLFTMKNQNVKSNTLKILIVDWKFSKKITRSSVFGKGFGICNVLDDCNYNHYLLQQNIYKYFLETYYKNWKFNGKVYENVEVVGMHLAVFHDTRDTYESIILPDVQEIVVEMMQDREIQLKRILAGDLDAPLVPGTYQNNHDKQIVELAKIDKDNYGNNDGSDIKTNDDDEYDEEIIPLKRKKD
jgi:hypothetical protein